MGPERTHRADSFTLQVLRGGAGFAITFGVPPQAVRVELPDWLLPPLMRALQQLDAALQDAATSACGGTIDPDALIAYTVTDWTVGDFVEGGGVAFRLRNERGVDAGFHISLVNARAFHRQLGDAIADAQAAHGEPPTAAGSACQQ